MKISFMALQKTVTVKELLLQSIINTYKMYVILGKPMRKFPSIDKKLYTLLISGKCNLKMLAYNKVKEEVSKHKPGLGQTDCTYLKFKAYGEVANDFLAKEITMLSDKDKCFDIFRDVNYIKDDFEEMHKHLSNFASYKFLRNRNERNFQRLDLILRAGFLQGP